MPFSDYDNKTIVLNELIGLRTVVLNSLDKKQKGLEGTVIDETKNTLRIETGQGERKIVKASCTFRFFLGKQSFVVEGREIGFRPHERIEKAMKYFKRRKL